MATKKRKSQIEFNQTNSSTFEFVCTEFVSYAITFLFLLFFAYFSTHMFSDRVALDNFIKSKLGPDVVFNFFSMILAVFSILSIAVIIERIFPHKKNFYTEKVLNEIPKSFYLIGSGCSGAVTALFIYAKYSNVSIEWGFLILANFTGIMYFAIGVFLKYFLDQRHIKAATAV